MFGRRRFKRHIYLVGRQKAKHTLGHDLADVEQQATHFILEGIRLCVLKGGTELPALRSCANSAHPNLQRSDIFLIRDTNVTHCSTLMCAA